MWRTGVQYTPDISKGTVHAITLLGATATIANPLNSPGIAGFSNVFFLVVTNSSGGASTLTFGTAYDTTYVAPDNGDTSTLMLLNIGGTWYQLGGTGGAGGTPTEIRSPDLSNSAVASDASGVVIQAGSGDQVVIGQQGNTQIVCRNNGVLDLGGSGQVVNIGNHAGALIAFFGHTFQGLQTLTGSWGGLQVGKDLATILANYGLIVDNSTL